MNPNLTNERSKQINIPDIINTAKDGAGVVEGLLSFISGLIHQLGHVNHPLLIDKIDEALGHLQNLKVSLDGVTEIAQNPSPVPSASETP